MDSSPVEQSGETAVPTTPLKPLTIAAAGTIPVTPAAATKGKTAGKVGSGSIYDVLGWDDDDIDELA
jgi:hypothetical protein